MKYLVFFFFYLFLKIAIGENRYVDSLNQELIKSQTDSAKAMINAELCWELRLLDQKEALSFGRKARSIALNQNSKSVLASALNDLSIIFLDMGELDSAKNLMQQALKLREFIGDEAGAAAIHNKLGILYQNLVDFENAIFHTVRALAFYESIDHKPYIIYCLNNLAAFQREIKNFPEAKKRNQDLLKLRIELQDSVGVASTHGNLASVYSQLDEVDSARKHFESARHQFSLIDAKMDEATNLHNFASFLLHHNELNEAKKHIEKALLLRSELGLEKGVASSQIVLATYHLKVSDYHSAYLLLHKALKTSLKNNFVDELLHIYKNLGLLFAKQRNVDSSQFYNSLYIDLYTRQYQDNLEKQVSAIETKYQTAKKEKALFEEQAKNNLLSTEKALAELTISNKNKSILALLALFISFVSVGAIAIVIYRKRVASEKADLLIEEQEKRILAVISAQEEERKRIAKDLHDGIVQDLTAIKLGVQNLNKPAIEDEHLKIKQLEKGLERCIKETREISHQMMPMALREFGLIPALEDLFERSFKPMDIIYDFEHVTVQQRIEEKVEVSLFRITQELVNNVLKHSKASVVLITLSMGKSYINLIFEDNGRGFDAKKIKKGLGMNNLNSRIKYINGTFIFESAANEGSTAIIRIPFQNAA